MQNQIFGIITIALCSVIYFYSFRKFNNGKLVSALVLLMTAGLLLSVFTASDMFLHNWDERYHALVAKNMIKHPFLPTLYENPVLSYDYQNWPGNHIWLHKQPMALWLMAGSMNLFGINEISLRLPSVIMFVTGIFLVFKTGEYFYSEKTGFLAAFLFSINGLILELTGGRVATDHVDTAFMFFILLSIYSTVRHIKRPGFLSAVLTGVFIGAAILTKWLAALVVIPVWMLMVYDSRCCPLKKAVIHFFVIILTVTVVALPWQIYIFQRFPLEAAYEAKFNMQHFTEVIEGRAGSVFYFLNRIRINYGELIYLPLIWFIVQIIRKKDNIKNYALLIWIFVPLIVFSLAKTKMQGYLLFTAPALFIVTAAFFYTIAEIWKNSKIKWFYGLIMLLLIALPVRYSIERVKPFRKTDRNPRWVTELKSLGNQHIEKGVLFNYSNPVEAMFYTDLTVYSNIPPVVKINELIKNGYVVFINNNGKLEKKYRNLKNVKYIFLQHSTVDN